MDPKKYYDTTSHGYLSKWKDIDKNQTDPSLYFRRSVISMVLELADIHAGDQVLEIGCGTGLVLREILKKTSPVFGADISVEMLKRAKESVLVPANVILVDHFEGGPHGQDAYLMVDNILDTYIPREMFDKIISTEVARYIPNLSGYLSSVRDLMKANSLFVFTVANLWSSTLFPLKFRIRQKMGLVNESSEIMQYFVTESSLQKALLDQNLQLVGLKRTRLLSGVPFVSRFVIKNVSRARSFERIDRALEKIPFVKNMCDMFVVAVKKNNSH